MSANDQNLPRHHLTARAAREHLKKLIETAGIAKPTTPYKLRNTYNSSL